MPKKKSAKATQAEVDKLLAELDARIKWKGDEFQVDDMAPRYVARTLETANWIAGQVFDPSAAKRPETVFAIYDRIVARTKFVMGALPGPGGKVPSNPEDTETPGADAIPQQPTPPAL